MYIFFLFIYIFIFLGEFFKGGPPFHFLGPKASIHAGSRAKGTYPDRVPFHKI
nr:MAG TPA: hypothetical protein [Caudoviricetes sp.]